MTKKGTKRIRNRTHRLMHRIGSLYCQNSTLPNQKLAFFISCLVKLAQWRQENISYKFLIVKGQKYRYVNNGFYTWDSLFSAALVRGSH